MRIRIKRRIIWVVGWMDYLFKIFSGKYASERNYYKYGKTKQGKLTKDIVLEKTNLISEMMKLEPNQYKLKKVIPGMYLIENR